MAPIKKVIGPPKPKIPTATQPSPVKRPGRIMPVLGKTPLEGP